MALKEVAKEHVKTVAGKIGGGIVGLVVPAASCGSPR